MSDDWGWKVGGEGGMKRKVRPRRRETRKARKVIRACVKWKERDCGRPHQPTALSALSLLSLVRGFDGNMEVEVKGRQRQALRMRCCLEGLLGGCVFIHCQIRKPDVKIVGWNGKDKS